MWILGECCSLSKPATDVKAEEMKQEISALKQEISALFRTCSLIDDDDDDDDDDDGWYRSTFRTCSLIAWRPNFFRTCSLIDDDGWYRSTAWRPNLVNLSENKEKGELPINKGKDSLKEPGEEPINKGKDPGRGCRGYQVFAQWWDLVLDAEANIMRVTALAA